jgi:hypothetical protein
MRWLFFQSQTSSISFFVCALMVFKVIAKLLLCCLNIKFVFTSLKISCVSGFQIFTFCSLGAQTSLIMHF